MNQLTGTILVVDDNAALAENLAEILSGAGYRTAWTNSAEEALEFITRGNVAALITDYRLPGLNGAQMITELRRRGVNIPAVVMSAYTDLETIDLSRTAGALEVLAKPVDVRHLITVVDDLGTEGTAVLVVDDNLSLGENLADALRGAGHNVVLGTSIFDTLSRPTRPGVAIVDYRLPDGSGVDLAERLTARDPRVRILFVSGYHEELAHELHGPLANAPRMEKPLDVTRLLAWVASAVAHEQAPSPRR